MVNTICQPLPFILTVFQVTTSILYTVIGTGWITNPSILFYSLWEFSMWTSQADLRLSTCDSTSVTFRWTLEIWPEILECSILVQCLVCLLCPVFELLQKQRDVYPLESMLRGIGCQKHLCYSF